MWATPICANGEPRRGVDRYGAARVLPFPHVDHLHPTGRSRLRRRNNKLESSTKRAAHRVIAVAAADSSWLMLRKAVNHAGCDSIVWQARPLPQGETRQA
jgi:hypothetical protein